MVQILVAAIPFHWLFRRAPAQRHQYDAVGELNDLLGPGLLLHAVSFAPKDLDNMKVVYHHPFRRH